MTSKVKLYFLALPLGMLFSCNTQSTNQEKSVTSDSSETPAMDTVKQIVKPTAPTYVEEGITYKNYYNDKYNFSIDYPLEILKSQGESPSGDGQIFKSDDGKATLWVYRDMRDNVSDKTYTIETAYKEDIRKDNPDHPDREITYNTQGSGFYVISGFDGNKIFYQKTIMKKDKLYTFLVEYKKSEKDLYSKITDRISKSFK
jgi:hypothetical protein